MSQSLYAVGVEQAFSASPELSRAPNLLAQPFGQFHLKLCPPRLLRLFLCLRQDAEGLFRAQLCETGEILHSEMFIRGVDAYFSA